MHSPPELRQQVLGHYPIAKTELVDPAHATLALLVSVKECKRAGAGVTFSIKTQCRIILATGESLLAGAAAGSLSSPASQPLKSNTFKALVIPPSRW